MARAALAAKRTWECRGSSIGMLPHLNDPLRANEK
jgi:hypothetical protein